MRPSRNEDHAGTNVDSSGDAESANSAHCNDSPSESLALTDTQTPPAVLVRGDSSWITDSLQPSGRFDSLGVHVIHDPVSSPKAHKTECQPLHRVQVRRSERSELRCCTQLPQVTSSQTRDCLQRQSFEHVISTLRGSGVFVPSCRPPNTDYIFFRDSWVPGTCAWIQEQSQFSSWLDDPSQSPQLLWVRGLPGSGKSVLSSFIINHLAELERFCQYFFVRFGDHNKSTLGSMLSSLAFQVVTLFF